MLEKAIHLLNLLEGFRSHPFLKGRLACGRKQGRPPIFALAEFRK
jgi:hypothetical protein